MEIRGADDQIIDLLSDNHETPLQVELIDGKIYKVWNIASDRDFGDQSYGITTNVSPRINDEPIDFFYTSDIVSVSDGVTGETLFFKDNLIG